MQTKYFRTLLDNSPSIRDQFAVSSPNSSLKAVGRIPYGGKLKHKELTTCFERLYVDRVVLRITDYCPHRCSYCYIAPRMTCIQKQVLPWKDIEKAAEYVGSNKEIRNVLISGGSPFYIDHEFLCSVIDVFFSISTVNQIYVAGGRPIFDPSVYTEQLANRLESYNRIDMNSPELSKRLGVSVQINHPDELLVRPEGIAPSVVEALSRLTKRGLHVYCQTTMLRGINDETSTIEELCFLLTQNNILPYYIIHTLDTPWDRIHRISFRRFLDISAHLEKFTGHIKPRFILATAIGKIVVNSNTNYEGTIRYGKRFIKIESPYYAEEFKKINRLSTIPPNAFVTDEGLLGIYYPDADV